MGRFIYILFVLGGVLCATNVWLIWSTTNGVRIGLNTGEQICEIRLEEQVLRLQEIYSKANPGWIIP